MRNTVASTTAAADQRRPRPSCARMRSTASAATMRIETGVVASITETTSVDGAGSFEPPVRPRRGSRTPETPPAGKRPDGAPQNRSDRTFLSRQTKELPMPGADNKVVGFGPAWENLDFPLTIIHIHRVQYLAGRLTRQTPPPPSLSAPRRLYVACRPRGRLWR